MSATFADARTESSNTSPILQVSDLRVEFATARGVVTAVDGVSFDISPRERLGLAGESGSGKSVMSLAILGLLQRAKVTGSVLFDGEDLLSASESRMRRVRAGEIGYVFQDPLASLDPVRPVGYQVAEVLRLRGASKAAAEKAAIDMLGAVGIPNPASRIGDYPHQFSGGMRQRVMIAIALIAEPRLLIADEPTTALDVRIQQQVIDLLYTLADERGVAITLITHDLAVLAGFADRVMVMHRGNIVERGEVEQIYNSPKADYTRALLQAMPRIDGPKPRRLATVSSAVKKEAGQ